MEKFTPTNEEPVIVGGDNLIDQPLVEHPVDAVADIVPEPVAEIIQEKKPENLSEPVGMTDWSGDRNAARMLAHEESNIRIGNKYDELGEEEFLKSGIERSSLSPAELKKMIRSMGMEVFHKRAGEREIQERYEREMEERRVREARERQKMFDDINSKHKVANFFDKILRFDLLGFMKKR